MRICLSLGLVAVLFGGSYAVAGNPRTADPIAWSENELNQATAQLSGPAGDASSACADCGDDGCNTGCSSRGWTAGVEATFLQPDYEGRRFDIDDETVDFDRNFESAPRIWVGVENQCGLGLRARYWELDAESTFAQAEIDVDSGDANGVFASSLLEMQTIDVEVTKRFCWRGWDSMASLGVRHATLGHDFGGQQFDFEDDGDADSSTVLLTRGFDGTGVTLGAEGSKPVGCRGLAFYWNARASVLWGNNKAAAAEIDVDANSDGDIDTNIDTATSSESSTLFIGEVQLGLEWKRPIECLSADVFVRGVGEAQFWGLDSDPLDITHNEADSLGHGGVNLYGATFSVGLSR